MRGTPSWPVSSPSRRGIIPAYAGNTRFHASLFTPSGDHPRVCGEHPCCALTMRPKSGSSPRMRGTPTAATPPRRSSGIIPAYAGNTRQQPRRCRQNRDHPRVCGEHPNGKVVALTTSGSSPRMRGTLVVPLQHVPRAGIIPAYAGNTRLTVSLLTVSWDHPRVCGEHFLGICKTARIMGSSPRMRGTLGRAFRPVGVSGIIPAYAGNTQWDSGSFGELRDHPRVCGEHQVLSSRQFQQRGSSPRMRGTPALMLDADGLAGIIPAYAGNTTVFDRRHQRRRDHPRVCGEHA